MSLIYDKKHNIFYREEDVLTPREIDERKKRIKNALRMADAKIESIERDKPRRGYCPKCRELLPLSGQCHCGYKKPSGPIVTGSGKVNKGYVNPQILKMYK